MSLIEFLEVEGHAAETAGKDNHVSAVLLARPQTPAIPSRTERTDRVSAYLKMVSPIEFLEVEGHAAETVGEDDHVSAVLSARP